jgi:hypothetical protein
VVRSDTTAQTASGDLSIRTRSTILTWLPFLSLRTLECLLFVQVRVPAQMTNTQRMVLSRPVVDSSEQGARLLADAYLDEIRRYTLGAVRTRVRHARVELVLLWILPLFRFATPEIVATPERIECRYSIIGGVLAKRSGGCLTIAQLFGSSPELYVTVEDYTPRLDSGRPRGGLRTLAYRLLQQPAHEAIGKRYLERMAARSQ